MDDFEPLPISAEEIIDITHGEPRMSSDEDDIVHDYFHNADAQVISAEP